MRHPELWAVARPREGGTYSVFQTYRCKADAQRVAARLQAIGCGTFEVLRAGPGAAQPGATIYRNGRKVGSA